MRILSGLLLISMLVLFLPACGESEVPATPATEGTGIAEPVIAVSSVDGEPSLPVQNTDGPGQFLLTRSEQGLPPELAPLSQAWVGDYDGMVERRVVRILTVYQLGGYFLDGPQEKGITYDLAKMFEAFLNERLGSGHVKLHVVLIPVEFDQLLDGLVQGYGDIAAAGLSITPERDEIVDFGAPLSREVKEIVITGPGAPELKTIEDLSGQQIYVKPGSSYRVSLERLNRRLAAANRKLIEIVDAPALLEDVDLLEMVSAGLLPMIAMDDYKARFWAEILEGITPREDLVIRDGQRLGWAMRENSSLLKAEIDEFARINRQGTLMGNILIKRYLKNKKWVRNALDPSELGRFESTIGFFKQYAGQYGFDHLMIAAQGYQESRLDQNVRSSAGAVGVMQLLPSTAAD
ncbi:MAG: membrane-bound lytic murein transglycosylase MltF, partial [Bacteroidia bacterium]